MTQVIITTTQPKVPQIPYNAKRTTLVIRHSGTTDGSTLTANEVFYDFTGDDQGVTNVGKGLGPYASEYFNKGQGDLTERGVYLQSVGGNVKIEWAEQVER